MRQVVSKLSMMADGSNIKSTTTIKERRSINIGKNQKSKTHTHTHINMYINNDV
jgi:hypothetical protein